MSGPLGGILRMSEREIEDWVRGRASWYCGSKPGQGPSCAMRVICGPADLDSIDEQVQYEEERTRELEPGRDAWLSEDPDRAEFTDPDGDMGPKTVTDLAVRRYIRPVAGVDGDYSPELTMEAALSREEREALDDIRDSHMYEPDEPDDYRDEGGDRSDQ